MKYRLVALQLMEFIVILDRITVVAIGIFIIATNIIVCILLWILEKFNEKRYRTSLTNPSHYSLSERFQLNENIKTAKIIRRVAEVVNVLNIFLGIFIGISHFYEIEVIRKYAYLILHLFISFYGYTFAIVGMTANPIWYRKFKGMFNLI
uniref:Uncharacterized protein n=1 Tax=Panagrolaimus superbus TaxID=310955 RepID=A0A914YY06_9BILA